MTMAIGTKVVRKTGEVVGVANHEHGYQPRCVFDPEHRDADRDLTGGVARAVAAEQGPDWKTAKIGLWNFLLSNHMVSGCSPTTQKAPRGGGHGNNLALGAGGLRD